MKIRHKETGKVIELMNGTKYPKSAYDLVTAKKQTAAKPEEKTTEKKATAKNQTAALGDQKPSAQ